MAALEDTADVEEAALSLSLLAGAARTSRSSAGAFGGGFPFGGRGGDDGGGDCRGGVMGEGGGRDDGRRGTLARGGVGAEQSAGPAERSKILAMASEEATGLTRTAGTLFTLGGEELENDASSSGAAMVIGEIGVVPAAAERAPVEDAKKLRALPKFLNLSPAETALLRSRDNSVGLSDPSDGLPIKALSFPAKLHAILSRKEHSHIVSWMPHGRAWKVHDPKAFEYEVIPKFFVRCKYSSFVRQANAWGFRRVNRGPDRNAYYHDHFLRGRKERAVRMRRPATSDKERIDPRYVPDFERMSREDPLPEEHEERAHLEAPGSIASKRPSGVGTEKGATSSCKYDDCRSEERLTDQGSSNAIATVSILPVDAPLQEEERATQPARSTEEKKEPQKPARTDTDLPRQQKRRHSAAAVQAPAESSSETTAQGALEATAQLKITRRQQLGATPEHWSPASAHSLSATPSSTGTAPAKPRHEAMPEVEAAAAGGSAAALQEKEAELLAAAAAAEREAASCRAAYERSVTIAREKERELQEARLSATTNGAAPPLPRVGSRPTAPGVAGTFGVAGASAPEIGAVAGPLAGIGFADASGFGGASIHPLTARAGVLAGRVDAHSAAMLSTARLRSLRASAGFMHGEGSLSFGELEHHGSGINLATGFRGLGFTASPGSWRDLEAAPLLGASPVARDAAVEGLRAPQSTNRYRTPKDMEALRRDELRRQEKLRDEIRKERMKQEMMQRERSILLEQNGGRGGDNRESNRSLRNPKQSHAAPL